MNSKSTPWQVLLALTFAGFLVPFMSSALNLTLPQLVEKFHISAVVLTLVVSTYLVSTAIFQVPAARLGDIVGRKKVFVAGIAILVISSILSAFAWSAYWLLFFRLLAGIGSACVFGTSSAILSAVYPAKERGQALGIYVATVYAGVAIGPFFGANYLTWQTAFISGAVIGIPAFIMASIWIKDEWLPAKGEPFDYRGSIVFAVALAAVILGCSFVPSLWGWSLLVFGVAGMFLCVRMAKKMAFPVFNFDLFSGNRAFRLSSLTAVISYTASFALGFILSLYLQYVKGMDVRHVGYMMMIQPMAQTIVSPISGRISDKINPYIMTTLGLILITVAAVALTTISPETSIPFIAVAMATVGIGFGIFSSPNVNILMSSVEKRHYGLASATIGTTRLIGQAMSLAIATMAIHFHMGDEKMSVENGDLYLISMKTVYIAFAVLCAVGLYLSSSRVIGKYAKENWRALSTRLSARMRPAEDGKNAEK